MSIKNISWRIPNLALVAAAALSVLFVASDVMAQGHGGGRGQGGGHDAGSTSHGDGHTTEGHSSGHDGAEGRGGRGARGGRHQGGRGSGHQSLRDIFRGMQDEAEAERSSGPRGSTSSGSPAKGKRPSKTTTAQPAKGKGGSTSQRGGKKPVKTADDDSDRPSWAGTKGPESKPGRPNLTPSIKKGSIYGDMYVILRNDNGEPILKDGYVQVYYIDPTTQKLTCCIPRDDEGNFLPVDGVAVLPIEVELGRLSVGRSPLQVLSAQYDEAIKTINSATAITVDAAGRLVLTLPDGSTKTIDSPVENLALYVELINTGTLSGVTATLPANLSFLTDGKLTVEDLKFAASFFAAASDKTIPVTVDAIVYMNTILKIDGTIDPGDYVDYSSFNYDRAATYSTMTIEVLVQQPDGTWKPTTVNIYDAVFSSTALTASNVAGFTAATDDARAVINFIHEFSVPTTSN